MRRKKNNSYLYLAAGVVLLIVILFYFLSNISTFRKKEANQNETLIGSTTFKLLDQKQCSYQCNDGLHCDNLYLFSVNSVNDKAVLQFLKEFKPKNGCSSKVLFQSGSTAIENWKTTLTAKPDEINFPNNAFAFSYIDMSSFSMVDLENGKANGKFRKYNSDGKLFIEQELVNSIAEGKRIVLYPEYKVVQEWKNNSLISVDTIK